MDKDHEATLNTQKAASALNDYVEQQVQVGIDQADRGELIDHSTVFRHLQSIAIASDKGK